MRFIRFGQINKLIDYKDISANGYHSPPVAKGLYAFPEHKVEIYLVAWKYDKAEEAALNNLMRKDRKVFTYCGPIWHHFVKDSKSNHIQGAWALDAMSDYKKILRKNFSRFIYVDGRHIRCSRDHFEVFIPAKIA